MSPDNARSTGLIDQMGASMSQLKRINLAIRLLVDEKVKLKREIKVLETEAERRAQARLKRMGS